MPADTARLRSVRYGLIGSGMMGQEHIRNIRLLEGASVAALSDPDDAMRARAQALADGCAAFADHAALIAADLCDAYVVASPNHTHFAILRDLLATGKPVLIEKPLATTPADCAELARLARGAEQRIWVAMEYRYMPPVQRLLAELRSGTAGRLRMIAIREHRFPFLRKVGDWNRFAANTGGTLVEKCCHFFDLMRLMAGAEPVRVYASGGMDVNFRDEAYPQGRPDILDNAFVVVDFANGIRAMLDLCMFAEGAHWQELITATGDAARLEARVPGPARFAPGGAEREAELAVAVRTSRTETVAPVAVDPAILAAGDHHGATFYQHRGFLDLVRNGTAPEVTLHDGAVAVTVGASAEESARTGEAVRLG
jgi:myo-inositol 2-dehydrogenase/D-chiro-inositol 1-dehydrogenase